MHIQNETVKSNPEADLQALRMKVVELFYDQTTTPEYFTTEEEICQAFSTLLLDYWHLCSIITFLVDEEGRLRERAMHADEHTDASLALEAAAQLARQVQQSGEDCDVWLDEERGALADEHRIIDMKSALEQAKMSAGVGAPIYARGELIGVLVAVTNTPADLRAARRGIRFIATPIVTAINNARRAAALRDQGGHIDRLYRELKEHAAALEEANRELQRVARYRSLFLARMSHELRTPLTSILGFAEILLDQEDLTEAQRRFCQKIQSSGLQQQESLNALVDLSRLEAGHSELFLHEFSLREMLRESCAAVARLARKADVTLERAIDPGICTVVSDEGKLRQVLYNFLAFAIHRTSHGGRILIEVSSSGADGATGAPQSFHIEITDDGEPLADPAHIFELFDSGHEPGAMPNDRGTDMNELGLVIAHRLIAVLNGTVELSSAEPQGLRVRLTFPQLPPATAHE